MTFRDTMGDILRALQNNSEIQMNKSVIDVFSHSSALYASHTKLETMISI